MGLTDMFVFRKKNRGGEKIENLLELVRQDPDNVKNRLRLADHYVRVGAKESAIREYQSTAQYLQKEGFNLKAISIYKKISSLGGMSLSDHRALAAIYTHSGLSAEAKKTFREILRIEPGDSETLAALKRLDEEGDIPPAPEIEETLEETHTPAMDDADAVPIETLLAPSEEEPHTDPSAELGETPAHDTDLAGLSKEGEAASEAISGGHEPTFGFDTTEPAPDDFLETAQPIGPPHPDDALHGEILADIDLTSLSEGTEDTVEDTSPKTEEMSEPDMANSQPDDALTPIHPTDNETSLKNDVPQEQILTDMDIGQLSDDMEDPSEDAAGHQKGSEFDLTNLQFDDIFQTEGTTEPFEGVSSVFEDSLPDSAQETLSPTDVGETTFPEPSGTEERLAPSPLRELEEQVGTSPEDPDLHYHLGVAYREMELTDRAIDEFTKALERGNKSLECLTMLAKCYFEKGLFQESAEFIHRALRLDNLTQDQIDLLHRQLEEAEAVGRLG